MRKRGQRSPNCGRCGATKVLRVRDGYLECRECKRAYLRLVQSEGLTREQARVVDATLSGLGFKPVLPKHDPDATTGVNDAAWAAGCVRMLTSWVASVGLGL
jgi:hypothetical protein